MGKQDNGQPLRVERELEDRDDLRHAGDLLLAQKNQGVLVLSLACYVKRDQTETQQGKHTHRKDNRSQKRYVLLALVTKKGEM
jgi:hypothetical protein